MKPRHLFFWLSLLGVFFLLRIGLQNADHGRGRRLHRMTFEAQDRGPSPETAFEAAVLSKPGPKKDSSKPHAHGPVVTHQPQQPKSGEVVLVTIDFKDQPVPNGNLTIEYQIVEPGKYIALKDPAYEKQWVALPMDRKAAGNGAAAGANVFTAELPAALQKHRRLVRYRIRVAGEGAVLSPDPADAQHNFAYFVYDGVPAWKGAIDPDGNDPKLRTPVTYSRELLERIPVYHLISSKSAVEKATWSEADSYGNNDRNSYRYTGTMVYDGVVYDHIGFRARGGSWRHAMGKNMWKFNFLPGHRFEARDDYGNRYRTKWDKLNLGACIQQGDYGMRGEQGMFEAVGFKLFNLAGMEASKTHWIHFRIIDQAAEDPSDQYAGDFWGLYLAVENVDEHFLKEHDLPPGNLYKIEGMAKTAFNGNPAITNQSDVRSFFNALRRQQLSAAWWMANVDVQRYFNYRSIIECIHHYDLDGGKNYFYYANPESHKWIAIPWDIDLTWGDNMFGGGGEPFYRSGALAPSACKAQYQERLAEIRDLLFNPEQTGRLIDEYASMIWDPKGGPSMVDADRAKWDFHPVMTSPRAMSMKAGEGRFYFGNPHNRFDVMIKYMKNYVAKRAKWIDSRFLADYRPPAAPKIAKAADLKFSETGVPFQIENPTATAKMCRWRLAEITDPASATFDPQQPWKYEIQSIWEGETKDPQSSASVPTQLLAAGHTYRVRARCQEQDGQWSRWSAPVQFSVPAKNQ